MKKLGPRNFELGPIGNREHVDKSPKHYINEMSALRYEL